MKIVNVSPPHIRPQGWIYGLKNVDGDWLYVGECWGVDPYDRIRQHRRERPDMYAEYVDSDCPAPFIYPLGRDPKKGGNKAFRRHLEMALIKFVEPKYNIVDNPALFDHWGWA